MNSICFVSCFILLLNIISMHAMEENNINSNDKNPKIFQRAGSNRNMILKIKKPVKKVRSYDFEQKHLSLEQREDLASQFIVAIKSANVKRVEELLNVAKDPQTNRVQFTALKDKDGDTPLVCIIKELTKVQKKLFGKKRKENLRAIYRLLDKHASIRQWTAENHEHESALTIGFNQLIQNKNE